MARWIDRYCRVLEALMVAGLAIMVVLVFGNVVLRYAFDSGISVSEEVSRWLFVWITFLGAIVAQHRHGHLGTDMLISRLPLAGRKLCWVLSQLLILWVAWLLLKGAWEQAQINATVQAPVSGASMAIFYASGILFGASVLLMVTLDLLRLAAGRLDNAELVAVQESEDLAQLAKETP